LKRVFKKGMKRGTAKAHESSSYDSDSEWWDQMTLLNF
jgi:hypothetical protein